jgi:hypothetical protein
MATMAAELKKQTTDQTSVELSRWKTRIAVLWIVQVVSYAAELFLNVIDPKWITARQSTSTQITDLGISFFFFVPCLMAWLTLTLNETANRWTNRAYGTLNALLLVAILISSYAGGASPALRFNGTWSCAVALLTVWYAWKWPKREA